MAHWRRANEMKYVMNVLTGARANPCHINSVPLRNLSEQQRIEVSVKENTQGEREIEEER